MDGHRGDKAGERVLIAAIDKGEVQGAVQLICEMRANGRHRAEAGKLFVHRRARRKGLARALLGALEREAFARGITLLLMDTRKGGDADRLCTSLGYTFWGEVPDYARSHDGFLLSALGEHKRTEAIGNGVIRGFKRVEEAEVLPGSNGDAVD